MDSISKIISTELNQKEEYIQNVINLMDEGNTLPFIARYRKEAHGSMDDTTLRQLEERLNYLRNLETRRDEVKKSIDGQEKLTPELAEAIDNAKTLAEVEDLYRPYKQKRKTRGSVARERGLTELANIIRSQKKNLPSLSVIAADYVNPGKDVPDIKAALDGASDIIAEDISDDAEIRKELRNYFIEHGTMTISPAKDEESVYQLYYNFSSPLKKLRGHQILAINRGEKEEFLKVSLEENRDHAIEIISGLTVYPSRMASEEAANFVLAAGTDGYDRLLRPSLVNEIRSSLTEEASDGAIHNFALNLKPLLLQPPIKGHITMGLDPGYRMGCKVAVIDATGKVLDTAVVYPTYGERQKNESIEILAKLVKKHGVEHIAIGNGTASRETEQMAVELIHRFKGVSYMMVNEAGASVYSASKLAAEEFPQFDVNLRSAVSIARRMQDPLAELVKIEPKAIGVGQYQHDMPQKKLEDTLDGVVIDCVNGVGVDLNTASPSLLGYVAGLNSTVAKNIAAYREENGVFTSRSQLKKVPRLGPKAFQQCAGFLRVPESKNILDHTGVHPESYPAAKALLEYCGYTLNDVKAGKLTELNQKIKDFNEKKLAELCGIGVPTLRDIVAELVRPGRDPRDELPKPVLRQDILSIDDLKPDMICTGTVRNVIDFGVFIDIGVHQDGLVHISQICDHYIKHPSEILHVGDIVKVRVLDIDIKRKRISLTMKEV